MLSAKALNGPLAIGDAGADADAKAAPVRTMRIQPQLKVWHSASRARLLLVDFVSTLRGSARTKNSSKLLSSSFSNLLAQSI